MRQVKRFTTSLVVRDQDGRQLFLELTVTPTGFSVTNPDLSWMDQCVNLREELQTMLGDVGLASLPSVRRPVPAHS
jgi:hypothetical protein